MIQRYIIPDRPIVAAPEMIKYSQGNYMLYADHLAEIAEKDKEIKRLESALKSIHHLCSARDDYAAVNVEVGMIAMKALKEQP